MPQFSRNDILDRIARGEGLRGANLVRTDLSGMHLSGVDLAEANLRMADLNGADLREAARLAGACEYVVKEDLLEIRRILLGPS